MKEPGEPTRHGGGFTRRLGIAVLVVALALAAWNLRGVLLLTFAAVILGLALHRAALAICRIRPLPLRPLIIAMLLAAIIALVLLGVLFGNQIADQAAEFRQRLPAIRESFMRLLAGVGLGGFEPSDLLSQVQSSMPQLAGGASAVLSGGAAGLGGLLLIVFLGLFLALDPGTYRDGALRLAPPSRRPRLAAVADEIADGLTRWLYYQALSSAAVGLVTGIGLWTLGVPLSGLLGLLTGLLGFIPVLGSVLGGVLSVLVALTVGPLTALWAALFTIVVQQLEGNVLVPLVQREGVDLPPALTVVGVLGFGTVLGLPGAVLALPLLLVARTLILRLYIEDTLEAASANR